MKICFRIGPDQGSEQAGPQPPERYSSAHPTAWSPRSALSSASLRTKSPADHSLRRGTACCARCSVARQRYPLAITCSIAAVAHPLKFQARPTSPKTSSATGKRREIIEFYGISNRFWPKNGSYRKQTIKHRLTGAGTHIKDFSFLALFAYRFQASYGRQLKTERFFPSCRTTSTRFWSKSRSHRKQTIKPLLPGSRNAQCVPEFLHDSRTVQAAHTSLVRP